MQAAGELARKKRDALDRHPMGAREAIRIICELHTYVDDRGVVRANFGMPPDFAKIDGDLCHEAWRVARAFAGISDTNPSPHHDAPRR
jgi:hypothetical protein